MTALTNSSISIGWPAGNATSWNVYLNGTLTDDSPVSSNSYTFDNLTEYEVNYTIGVSAVCGSEVSDVTTTTVLLCVPAPTSIDGTGITNVTFGGMEDVLSMNNSPYYYDRSSQIGAASPGGTVNMSIEYSTGDFGYNTWVWVDWNQDHTFSDEECVYTSTSTISSGTLGLSFVVPDTIAPGNYRVRIQGAYFDYDKNPCFTGDWSYLVDYTLHIEAPSQVPAVGDYWSDDFEAAECGWEFVNGNPDNSNVWVCGTGVSYGSGTKAMYISDGNNAYNYNNSHTSFAYATKLLSFTANKFEFSFDWNANGESSYDYLRAWLAPGDFQFVAGQQPDGSTDFYDAVSLVPEGWIALDDSSKLNTSNEWQTQSVTVNVPAGNWFLVFMWCNDDGVGDNPPAAIDNVSITKVACEYLVEGVQVINSTVTTSTANVLWDASEATAWQVQTKAGDGEWTTLASSDVDFSLSGVKEIAYLRNLTPGTEYQVRVRANCGNEQYGTWSEVVSFTTECAPRAVTNDNKFTANFDDMTGSTYPSENNLPICWNYINTCGYFVYSLYPYVYSSSSESNSGANHLRFFSLASANYTYYNPKPQYAILPPMQDVSNLRIKFYARAYNIGTDYDATFKVGVLTNPNDASTFTEIATYTPATTTYELYTIPFNTYSGNGNYIAIMIDAAEVPESGSFYRTLFIDDITVEPIPECVVPTNLRTVSVAHDGATVKWAANLEESWNLKYHAQGENQWIEVNGLQDSTYTFTELNAETEYEWQVQAACGANLTSDWSSLGTFTTEAEPQVTCHEWQLVTSANDLHDGDQIIIAASGNYNVAMSTTQKDNNRDVATIIKDGNKLTLPVGDDVQVLTANYLATNDAWTLYTGEGYLYAASSSSNHLRTEEEIDEYGNAYWTITFSNGVASIVANGNNSHKIMKYNNNSRIISCYASGQSPLAIYRLIDNRRLATKDTTVAHALPFIFTMAGQPDTIITSYGEFNLSYVIEADPVNCDSVLNVHLTVNEPMFTVTLEAGAGTIALPTPLTGNSTHPVDLANLVPELDNNCTEWTFAGWSSAAVAETNDAPDFVTTISPTSDTTLYAVYVKSEGGSGDAIWQKANTIAIGDQMVLVYETGKYELSGISTTSTKYGERVSYSVAPTGVYPLTVVAGTAAASYSLKTSDDNYLTWTSGNSLNKASSVTDNSSWSISFDNDGNADIANISQDTRKIRYNTGSPRFACYEGGQSAIQLYKLSNPVVNTYNSNPVCDVNYNITLVQPADGSISSDPAQTASAGAVVTLTATPNAGYTFGSWEVRNVDNGGTVEVTNDQFIMPAANVEVHASFTAIEYTVTATANPAAGGTITGTGTYSYEGAASLTASANNGYEFVNWTNEQGAVVCTTATYNFIVTRDSALTANFALKEYTITMSVVTGGTLSHNLPANVATMGTEVTLIATPNEGLQFDGDWTVQNISASSPVEVVNNKFTMPAGNVTVTGYFSPITYTVSAVISPDNAGSVSGTGSYNHGAEAQLRATPASGYEFVNWTNAQGAVVSTDADYNFIVNRDSALTANFELKEYTITMVQPNVGGTLSHNLLANVATMGTEVTLIATPNEGFQFDGDWTVQNTSASSPVTVENNKFTMPAGNVTVTGYFSPITYTVSAVISPDNAGSVSGTGSYNHGAEAQLRATPASGYEFVNWTNAQGAVVSTDDDYNFIVNRDSALTANFELKEYTITYMDGNTELDVDTFAFGADVTAIADPEKECKEFAGWNETLPATMPANNIVLYAQWNDLYYNITASADPVNGGSVTFNPEPEVGTTAANSGYLCNTPVTLTATPAQGYTFTGWSVNGQIVSADAEYDIIATQNSTLVATFIMDVPVCEEWQLVTSANDLQNGDQIIIAAANDNVAMSTTQNMNNRAIEQIVKTDNGSKLEEPSNDVQILTLQAGSVDNTWALYTGSGYLYAASSSNNYLKTQDNIDANASWTITVQNGNFTIKAKGSNTRNIMRYNTNSSIISCYSSGQEPLVIYKLADMKAQSDTTAVVLAESFEWRGTTYPASGDYEVLVGTAANGCDSVRVLHLTLQQKVATPTFTPAAGSYTEPQTVTINCATQGATIYYTTDGTEPTANSTQYTDGFTLNANTTVKAIAVKDGEQWLPSEVATAAYTFDFPSYTVTFNPGDNGTVPQATMSGNQYTEPVDFANNVPSPAATCTDWTFAGWSTTAVMGNTTTEPTFVTSPYYPTGDIMLYAVYQKTEQGSSAATWIKATSIDVGDVVVLVNENAKVELSGVTTYGTTSSYSSSPIGTYPLTVVQGSGTGYYSLKTSDNTDTYLSWTSGNALATSNTVNSSSSWDISINSNGNAVISNVGTTSRKLQYNSGSPRFACYTSSQATVQFYKMMSTSTTTYNSNPVCSYMVYVDGNMQNGTVIVDPATATTDGALIGSTVTLTDTPNQGYHFGYWQVSTDATYTNPVTVTNNSFEMPTSDVYVNAIFWIDTLHITATVNPAQTGSVDPSEAYVIYGDQVTLTATPAQDYLFENWTSNGQPVGTDAVVTITATQDSALVANFVQMEHVVTPIFTSNPEGNTFTTEDVVTVTITTTTPNATIYYTMDGTDPVVPAGRNVTGTQVYEGPITLTETTTLKAVAAAENMINSEIATATYTINQMYYVDEDNSIEHGTVTADPEKGIENTQISLTAVPEEGYIFKAWNVYNANDADQTVTVTNNQFNMPAYDVMVSATFVPDTFTVTFVLNGAQFVAGYTPISRYWYKQQDANLPTAADMEYEGHSFDGWYENANFDGNSWTSVPDTAKSNKTYYAKWNVNNYGLTINYVDFNGQTVHESYSQSLDYGTGYAVASPAVDTYMPELDTVKGTMGTEAVTVNVRYAQVQMLNIDNVTVCTGETTQEINYELIPFFMEYFSGMRQGFETVIDGPMSITAGSNGIAAFTAVNDGTEPLTNTITVTPHDTLGGHTVKGVPQTFTITVNPKNVSEFSEIACDSYTWTAADTTIVDEGENDYVHVFQNQYGCDSTVTLHLNLHKTPTVVVAVDKAYYCTTENVTLNSTGSSTGSEYTYAWTGPNNYESTETNPVLASPLTGEMSGTYQLTVTHTATGCVSEPASVEVVVNTPGTPGYLFTITTHGDAYANIDGSLDEVTPVFATPEVNHFLDGANVNYTVVNNAENSYNAVGDYTITWTATDECGNEATTTQVLHVTQNVCPVATDADNNTYPSVQLAGKCWMAKNLRTTRFSDGRAVNNLMVYDNIMYPNTTENLSRYGYLYDWDNAMDAQNGTVTLDANNHVQGICPTGWRIPNHNDFMDIAGSNSATDMYDLRYNQYWLDGGGNNSTNYSLLPGGCYNDNTGRYENLLGNAYLWGVNPASPSQPRAYWADCKCYMWQVSDTTNGMGHSVRCIKD